MKASIASKPRDQLKVYRQAVLKHAFEGKLTVQWREKKKRSPLENNHVFRTFVVRYIRVTGVGKILFR